MGFGMQQASYGSEKNPQALGGFGHSICVQGKHTVKTIRPFSPSVSLLLRLI